MTATPPPLPPQYFRSLSNILPPGEIIALESILGPASFTPPPSSSPHTLRIIICIPRIGNVCVTLDTSPPLLYPLHPPLITISCPKLKLHERVFLALKGELVLLLIYVFIVNALYSLISSFGSFVTI
jgi:hypothetical protein